MSVAIAPPATKSITGEELLAMGDIGPCELIDGRIVPMSPTSGKHGVIESRLALRLGSYVEQHGPGWILSGESGIYTQRNPDRVRGMDVAFISRLRLAALPEGFLDAAPELVVEIVSPTDRRQDIRDKIGEYFAIGVDRVWLVNPDSCTVHVYRSSSEVKKLKMGDILEGEGVLDGFALPLDELFVG